MPMMGAMPQMDGGGMMGAGEQGGSAMDHLRMAIEAAQAALQAEPDDEDSQQLAAAIQSLYKVLAARQKESDGMMQGKLSPRAMRRM